LGKPAIRHGPFHACRRPRLALISLLALDMGAQFDLFSPKSWPADESVGEEAQRNRALLAAAMGRGGFWPYSKEWWHFTLANEPFPNSYFRFSGALTFIRRVSRVISAKLARGLTVGVVILPRGTRVAVVALWV
jgi:hypothetical protein